MTPPMNNNITVAEALVDAVGKAMANEIHKDSDYGMRGEDAWEREPDYWRRLASAALSAMPGVERELKWHGRALRCGPIEMGRIDIWSDGRCDAYLGYEDLSPLDSFPTEAKARTALEAAAREWLGGSAMPGVWQPIETAPKDGTVITLTNGGWVDRGWWSTSMWLGAKGPGWVIDDERECGIVYDDITHWMPLPLPPVQGSGG